MSQQTTNSMSWIAFFTQEPKGILTLLITLALAAVTLFYVLRPKQSKAAREMDEREKRRLEMAAQQEAQKKSRKPEVNNKKKKDEKTKDVKHPLLSTTLKMNQDTVTSVAFNPKGKYIAVLSKDKTIRLVPTQLFKDENPHHQRVNVERDFGLRSCFSADGHFLYVQLNSKNLIATYNLKPSGDKITATITKQWPLKDQHKDDIRSMTLSQNNKFLVTVSESDDLVTLWNTASGDILHHFKTNKLRAYQADLSRDLDSKYLAVATYASEVVLYEVKSNLSSKSAKDREGNQNWQFSKVEKAMTLMKGGHSTSVYCVSFGPAPEAFTGVNKPYRIATGSKDGTWKMWDINVRHKDGEDPKCLYTQKIPSPAREISISPDGNALITVSEDSQLRIWSAEKGDLLDTITGLTLYGITEGKVSLSWRPDSKIFAVNCGRFVRVFHNPQFHNKQEQQTNH